MNKFFDKPNFPFELLMLVIIGARASSMAVSRVLLPTFGTFNLMALWLIPAFVLSALVFSKHLQSLNTQSVLAGVIIGVLLFLMTTCEYTALGTPETSVTMVMLCESASIILVPIFSALFAHRLPNKTHILATIMAMLGAVLISIGQGNITGGFMFSLAAGILYSLFIIILPLLIKSREDSFGTSFIAIGVMTLLSIIMTAVNGKVVMPKTNIQWFTIFGMAIICAGVGLAAHIVVQGRLPIERTGLFCGVIPIAVVITSIAVGSTDATAYYAINGLTITGIIIVVVAFSLHYFRYLLVKKRENEQE